jgi:5-methylcytosine-specific restriction endonuclease McrA
MTKRRVRNRDRAFEEQDGLCFYCLVPMTPAGEDLETSCTADHVRPKQMGGTSRADNIVAACFRCNQLKADDGSFAGIRKRKKRTKLHVPTEIEQAAQERKREERLAMWRQAVRIKA